MANRYMQQFYYSFTHMLTGIQGSISLVQEVKATLVSQGLTLTAVAFGTSGNSITFTVTGGATAGAEVVTVTGNSISVQVQTGVSTVTQVRTAMQAAAACTALVVTTGTSASTVATATVVSLAGGIDGVASSSINGVASVSQTGVGEFTITLSDAYNAFMHGGFTLLSATAQDLVPQLKSVDVVTAKTVVVRLLTGGSATDPTSACTLYCNLLLRNSSVTK